MNIYKKWFLGFVAAVSLLLVGNSLFKHYALETIRGSIPISNYDTLIVGDSHTMAAIDPSILQGVMNLSYHSETFILTYYKLLFLLKDCDTVKRVLIGYPHHSLSFMYESHLYGDNINKRFHFYQALLPFKVYLELIKFNFDVIFSKLIHGRFYLEPWIISQLFLKDLSTIPFLGGFYKSYNSRLSPQSNSSMISRLFFDGEMIQNSSSLQIKYLDKIIALLRSRGIEVFLINTPVHPSYYRLIPNRFIDMHKDFIKKLNKKYAVEYIDFSSLKLPDEFYGDGNHVNTFGAGVVSLHVDAWLKSINENNPKNLNYFLTDNKLNNNFFIGSVYYSYKKYRKALTFFNQAINDNLKNEYLFLMRGDISEKNGRLEEAIDFYNKALEINDKFEEAATRISSVKKRMDIIVQQTKKMEEILQNEPDNGRCLLTLGELYKNRGQLNKALLCLKAALEGNGPRTDVLRNTAEVYALLGDYSSAFMAFNRLKAIQPDNPTVSYNIACMLAMMQKNDEALAWLNKAVDEGYNKKDVIIIDEDIDNIRGKRRFQKIISKLK